MMAALSPFHLTHVEFQFLPGVLEYTSSNYMILVESLPGASRIYL